MFFYFLGFAIKGTNTWRFPHTCPEDRGLEYEETASGDLRSESAETCSRNDSDESVSNTETVSEGIDTLTSSPPPSRSRAKLRDNVRSLSPARPRLRSQAKAGLQSPARARSQSKVRSQSPVEGRLLSRMRSPAKGQLRSQAKAQLQLPAKTRLQGKRQSRSRSPIRQGKKFKRIRSLSSSNSDSTSPPPNRRPHSVVTEPSCSRFVKPRDHSFMESPVSRVYFLQPNMQTRILVPLVKKLTEKEMQQITVSSSLTLISTSSTNSLSRFLNQRSDSVMSEPSCPQFAESRGHPFMEPAVSRAQSLEPNMQTRILVPLVKKLTEKEIQQSSMFKSQSPISICATQFEPTPITSTSTSTIATPSTSKQLEVEAGPSCSQVTIAPERTTMRQTLQNTFVMSGPWKLLKQQLLIRPPTQSLAVQLRACPESPRRTRTPTRPPTPLGPSSPSGPKLRGKKQTPLHIDTRNNSPTPTTSEITLQGTRTPMPSQDPSRSPTPTNPWIQDDTVVQLPISVEPWTELPTQTQPPIESTYSELPSKYLCPPQSPEQFKSLSQVQSPVESMQPSEPESPADSLSPSRVHSPEESGLPSQSQFLEESLSSQPQSPSKYLPTSPSQSYRSSSPTEPWPLTLEQAMSPESYRLMLEQIPLPPSPILTQPETLTIQQRQMGSPECTEPRSPKKNPIPPTPTNSEMLGVRTPSPTELDVPNENRTTIRIPTECDIVELLSTLPFKDSRKRPLQSHSSTEPWIPTVEQLQISLPAITVKKVPKMRSPMACSAEELVLASLDVDDLASLESQSLNTPEEINILPFTESAMSLMEQIPINLLSPTEPQISKKKRTIVEPSFTVPWTSDSVQSLFSVSDVTDVINTEIESTLNRDRSLNLQWLPIYTPSRNEQWTSPVNSQSLLPPPLAPSIPIPTIDLTMTDESEEIQPSPHSSIEYRFSTHTLRLIESNSSTEQSISLSELIRVPPPRYLQFVSITPRKLEFLEKMKRAQAAMQNLPPTTTSEPRVISPAQTTETSEDALTQVWRETTLSIETLPQIPPLATEPFCGIQPTSELIRHPDSESELLTTKPFEQCIAMDVKSPLFLEEVTTPTEELIRLPTPNDSEVIKEKNIPTSSSSFTELLVPIREQPPMEMKPYDGIETLLQLAPKEQRIPRKKRTPILAPPKNIPTSELPTSPPTSIPETEPEPLIKIIKSSTSTNSLSPVHLPLTSKQGMSEEEQTLIILSTIESQISIDRTQSYLSTNTDLPDPLKETPTRSTLPAISEKTQALLQLSHFMEPRGQRKKRSPMQKREPIWTPPRNSLSPPTEEIQIPIFTELDKLAIKEAMLPVSAEIPMPKEKLSPTQQVVKQSISEYEEALPITTLAKAKINKENTPTCLSSSTELQVSMEQQMPSRSPSPWEPLMTTKEEILPLCPTPTESQTLIKKRSPHQKVAPVSLVSTVLAMPEKIRSRIQEPLTSEQSMSIIEPAETKMSEEERIHSSPVASTEPPVLIPIRLTSQVEPWINSEESLKPKEKLTPILTHSQKPPTSELQPSPPTSITETEPDQSTESSTSTIDRQSSVQLPWTSLQGISEKEQTLIALPTTELQKSKEKAQSDLSTNTELPDPLKSTPSSLPAISAKAKALLQLSASMESRGQKKKRSPVQKRAPIWTPSRMFLSPPAEEILVPILTESEKLITKEVMLPVSAEIPTPKEIQSSAQQSLEQSMSKNEETLPFTTLARENEEKPPTCSPTSTEPQVSIEQQMQIRSPSPWEPLMTTKEETLPMFPTSSGPRRPKRKRNSHQKHTPASSISTELATLKKERSRIQELLSFEESMSTIEPYGTKMSLQGQSSSLTKPLVLTKEPIRPTSPIEPWITSEFRRPKSSTKRRISTSEQIPTAPPTLAGTSKLTTQTPRSPSPTKILTKSVQICSQTTTDMEEPTSDRSPSPPEKWKPTVHQISLPQLTQYRIPKKKRPSIRKSSPAKSQAPKERTKFQWLPPKNPRFPIRNPTPTRPHAPSDSWIDRKSTRPSSPLMPFMPIRGRVPIPTCPPPPLDPEGRIPVQAHEPADPTRDRAVTQPCDLPMLEQKTHPPLSGLRMPKYLTPKDRPTLRSPSPQPRLPSPPRSPPRLTSGWSSSSSSE